jgi:putative ABC transport system substrate-binding protein
VALRGLSLPRKQLVGFPIVFLSVLDPVELGIVESMARPGGNITGFSTIADVLAGKRLELLKEIVPKLFRVAVLWNPESPSSTQQLNETKQGHENWGCNCIR